MSLEPHGKGTVRGRSSRAPDLDWAIAAEMAFSFWESGSLFSLFSLSLFLSLPLSLSLSVCACVCVPVLYAHAHGYGSQRRRTSVVYHPPLEPRSLTDPGCLSSLISADRHQPCLAFFFFFNLDAGRFELGCPLVFPASTLTHSLSLQPLVSHFALF